MDFLEEEETTLRHQINKSIMNILSTNPAIIVMESLDDCETLFDFIDRSLNTETKKRGVASVLFEILKFTKYTRMRHVDLHHGNIMITKKFSKKNIGVEVLDLD